jgi:hypothetical protein
MASPAALFVTTVSAPSLSTVASSTAAAGGVCQDRIGFPAALARRRCGWRSG